MIGKKFEHDKKLNEEIILDGLRVRNSNIRLSMIYYLKRLIKKHQLKMLQRTTTKNSVTN